MRRGISIPFKTLAGAPGVATLLAIGLAGPAPAMAQTVAVEVSGYVAPRCWVASPPLWQPYPGLLAPRGRAICNYSAPVVRASMRMFNETFLDRPDQPLNSTQGHLSALEIVVSPQI